MSNTITRQNRQTVPYPSSFSTTLIAEILSDYIVCLFERTISSAHELKWQHYKRKLFKNVSRTLSIGLEPRRGEASSRPPTILAQKSVVCGGVVRSGSGQGYLWRCGGGGDGGEAVCVGFSRSGTSSGWGRGPRHTAGSALAGASANFTSRPRRNDVDRRGGLLRRAPLLLAAPTGCKLADDACGSSRGCVTLRPNGDWRKNCLATIGCQQELPET